ncbi:MAG: amino acid adenylation domain-containing protein [Actinomycetota bacterium]
MTQLLHQLLEDSARRTPNQVAVVDRDRSISYTDLNRRANQVAALLADLGVRRGDRVGFCLNKSIESVIAIYGILKAGAAYVPFDPQAPPARLGYIADNAGISHLLTGTEMAPLWPSLIDGGAPLDSLIVLNSDEHPEVPVGTRAFSGRDLDLRSPDDVDGGPIQLDLAYILYTSGSTGQPKGVMLTHLNAMTFVEWTVEHYVIEARDRLSSHAPFHFDLSIFDLYAASLAGATVVLVPPETSVFPLEVANFIEQQEITVWYSVPSILSMLTQRGNLEVGSLQSLRILLFAGEVFPTKYLQRLMELLPNVAFANLYGPTETNVCTYYDVPVLPADMVEPIPIGKAIAGVECYVVAQDGSIAKSGEVGELYVRGSTVMQGYWANPERSSQSLIPNPFGGALHDNVYRTGDLVQELSDGNYRFLGRRDHQIKSRGYRIELGDIESALYAHPDVVECAVVAIPDETVSNRIKAHVVVRNGVRQAELVRFCSTRIPRYMIPEQFEFADALPKTSTGKIDRQTLASIAIPV